MKEKTVDLFGNEVSYIHPAEDKANNKALFSDYDKFIDKFKDAKTTDDCYTPQAVYDCVLDYVVGRFKLTNTKILRPFYPGGDYENCEYPKDCVVIDNPPFSIISKIAQFYIDNKIKFFLFAPHLTLFSKVDCTKLVVGADVIYENGAKVKTSFISNMFEDIIVMSDHSLFEKLNKICRPDRRKLPKYIYPDELLTVPDLQKCIAWGVSLSFRKSELLHVSKLDHQSSFKKAIFGAGFLMSKEAMQRKIAAQAIAEKKETIMRWQISDREKELIKDLK